MPNLKAKLLALLLLGCADNPPQGYFNREREERCLSESLDKCQVLGYTYEECLLLAQAGCVYTNENN